MPHALDLLPPVAGLVFREEDHRYTVKHKYLGELVIPSTTQVMTATEAKTMNYSSWRHSLLRRGIVQTPADADAYMEQHRKHRAQVGTDFHRLSECELLGHEPRVVEEESIEMLGRWREQFLPSVGIVQIVEQPLLHRRFFYCGTPDLLAYINGELCLVDWKTQQAGKERARDEWQLQVGAYAELIRACYGITVRKAIMLIITTERVTPREYNYADIRQGWRRFCGFLAEYHARQAKLGFVANHIALTELRPLFVP